MGVKSTQLCRLIEKIEPVDIKSMEKAQSRWSSIAKPLGSLGLLEEALIRIAGVTRSEKIDISKRTVIVMCADNGVVAQGVTQTGQDVTAIVTENMSTGKTSVCRMAKCANVEVLPVDIGVASPVMGENILQRCVRRGTADFTKEPAMTREEAEKAIFVGIDIVRGLSEKGVRLIATGEMGIGNTTTSSAVVSALLSLEPERVTGRGAGLSSEGLRRKIDAIARGIKLHKPDKNDAVDVLEKVGGLDIAGLCGVFLGGAIYKIPVLIDGFISAAAALCAANICAFAKDYMIASHVSGETAGMLLLNELGLRPMLYAGMCLGEGTGAVAVIPILDMALAVYNEMPSFEEISVGAYRELK